MKRFVCAAVAIAVVFLAVLCLPKTSSNSDFLRIHIRADSNREDDQK